MVLIAVVALILFGANKIPTFMKGLGTGIKEFKKASSDVQNELDRAMDEPPKPTQPPRTPPSSTVASGSASSQGSSTPKAS